MAELTSKLIRYTAEKEQYEEPRDQITIKYLVREDHETLEEFKEYVKEELQREGWKNIKIDEVVKYPTNGSKY